MRAAAFFFLGLAAARGHGDVHEEIAALTKQIETAPADAQLRLRRGGLHRVHRDWAAAGADFDEALKLDPRLTAVDLARGEMLGEAGRADDAIAAFDRFLAQQPGRSEGYAGRARVLAHAMKWEPAAEDFSRAISLAPQPEPALFIERARALRSAGKLDDAIRALDAGIARLGPLITLMQPAVDFENEAGHTDAALARLAKIIDAAPRKERWLLRRGELLEKAGRPAAAREAFAAAHAALEAIPADRRATAAMQDLAKSIEAALTRLR